MTPGDDLNEARNEARRIFQECQASGKRFQDQQLRNWIELVGPEVQRMINNRQYTENQLRHRDANMRIVALDILLYVWKTRTDPAFIEACRTLASSDPAFGVRSTAVICLGACFENTNDPVAAKEFASLVADGSAPIEVRQSAYQSLCSLTGDLGLWAETMEETFRFPEEVDWSFVQRFLDSDTARIRTTPSTSPFSQHPGLAPYQQGLAALNLGNLKRAIDLFSDAVALQPQAAGGYQMRARAYLKMGEINHAIDDFTMAISLNPSSARLYLDRSNAFRAKGDDSLAEKDRQRAVELDPGGTDSSGSSS